MTNKERFMGKKVREVVTGFTGTVTGIATYISGCDQALVVPHVDDKGGHRDGQWYDVMRLEVLSDACVALPSRPQGEPIYDEGGNEQREEATNPLKGGPQDSPSRRS